MVRLGLALVLAGVSLAAAAAIDAATARRTFFGIEMSGVMLDGPREVHWRECVDPQGRTLCTFAGRVDHGRLGIREDGALCFSYQSTRFAEEGCFGAYREAKGQYRFVGVDGDGSVFVTRRMRSGVKACSADDMVS
jgi:hypothetical protein